MHRIEELANEFTKVGTSATSRQESDILEEYCQRFFVCPGNEDHFKAISGLDVEVADLRIAGYTALFLSLRLDDVLVPLYSTGKRADLENLLKKKVVGMINAQMVVYDVFPYAFGLPVTYKKARLEL